MTIFQGYLQERCSSRLDRNTEECTAWVDPNNDVEKKSQDFTDIIQINPGQLKLEIRPGLCTVYSIQCIHHAYTLYNVYFVYTIRRTFIIR